MFFVIMEYHITQKNANRPLTIHLALNKLLKQWLNVLGNYRKYSHKPFDNVGKASKMFVSSAIFG